MDEFTEKVGEYLTSSKIISALGMEALRPSWFLPSHDTINAASGDDLDDLIGKLQLSYPPVKAIRRKHTIAGNLSSDENKRIFIYNMINHPDVQQEYQKLKAEYDARDPTEEESHRRLHFLSEMKGDKCIPRRQNFADLIVDVFSCVCFNNELWIYADGIFQRDTGQIRSFIINEIRNFAPYPFVGDVTREVREITAFVKGMCHCPEYPFDQLKWHIPVLNGIVSIEPETGSVRLLHHDPSYRLTRKLPVNYNPDADSGFIKSVLDQWVGPEYSPFLIQVGAMPFLQMWQGAMKLSYIFEGQPDAGKSSYCEFIFRFFGRGNYAEVDLMRLTQDRFAFAGLEGKYINVFDDLESFPLKGLGTFKNLTGSTYHRIERKGQDGYEGQITCTHLFSCNKPPSIKTIEDRAFWSRWAYIIFDSQFERDATFKQRLMTDENLSGYLNLIIGELIEMIRDAKRIRRMDAEEVQSLWIKSSDTIKRFIEEHFLTGDGVDTNGNIDREWWIDKDLVYDAYQKFCHESKIPPRTKASLTTALSTHKINQVQIRDGKKQVRGYLGIKWRDDKREGYTDSNCDPIQSELSQVSQGKFFSCTVKQEIVDDISTKELKKSRDTCDNPAPLTRKDYLAWLIRVGLPVGTRPELYHRSQTPTTGQCICHNGKIPLEKWESTETLRDGETDRLLVWISNDTRLPGLCDDCHQLLLSQYQRLAEGDRS